MNQLEIVTGALLVLIMLNICLMSFIVGFFIMTYFSDLGVDHFKSPTNNKFELDWTTRQVFSVFSRAMAERWYEARAHMHLGVFLSLLAAFHFIYCVRVDFMHKDDDYGLYVKKYYHGFQSIESVMTKIGNWLGTEDSQIELDYLLVRRPNQHGMIDDAEDYYYYQTFIAGNNVVGDFMNQSYV